MGFRYVIIEDAAYIRELQKGICHQIGGVCVGESDGGQHSLDLIRQTLPDVILIDLVLPENNGVDLVTKFREFWTEGRVVACTSVNVSSVLLKAQEAGVDTIVTKPFTKVSLSDAILELLNQKNEVAT